MGVPKISKFFSKNSKKSAKEESKVVNFVKYRINSLNYTKTVVRGFAAKVSADKGAFGPILIGVRRLKASQIKRSYGIYHIPPIWSKISKANFGVLRPILILLLPKNTFLALEKIFDFWGIWGSWGHIGV